MKGLYTGHDACMLSAMQARWLIQGKGARCAAPLRAVTNMDLVACVAASAPRAAPY